MVTFLVKLYGDYNYVLSFVTDKNCHQIVRKQDLYMELAEIGDWQSLCTNLEVPEAVISNLENEHLKNNAKKTKLLVRVLRPGECLLGESHQSCC